MRGSKRRNKSTLYKIIFNANTPKQNFTMENKINSYDAIAMFDNGVWEKGIEYDVNINVMLDGRIQLFKSMKHFKERGMNLRVYNTPDDMFSDFSF